MRIIGITGCCKIGKQLCICMSHFNVNVTKEGTLVIRKVIKVVQIVRMAYSQITYF